MRHYRIVAKVLSQFQRPYSPTNCDLATYDVSKNVALHDISVPIFED